MPKKSQSNQIDLVKLFGTVARNMGEQRETLNRADTYNNDHGDHMVEIFEVITQAMKERKNVHPADQLAYASQLLRNRKSGSAQVYANGLAQAAQQFQGQSVTGDNIGLLVQNLLGGGQAANQSTGSGGDILGSILSGLAGQQSQQQDSDDNLDLGDFVNAGMAFLNAKQRGSSTAEAAINALLSESPLGQSSHRKESGAMVANTIMQVLGSISRK